MKNNDDLKEKEIKQDKAIDKKELESASGGGLFSRHYIVMDDICKQSRCQNAICEKECCHPGAVKSEPRDASPSRQLNDPYVDARIIQSICVGCWNCDSKEKCPNGAIKWT